MNKSSIAEVLAYQYTIAERELFSADSKRRKAKVKYEAFVQLAGGLENGDVEELQDIKDDYRSETRLYRRLSNIERAKMDTVEETREMLEISHKTWMKALNERYIIQAQEERREAELAQNIEG